MENCSTVKEAISAGNCLFGTVDTWLIWVSTTYVSMCNVRMPWGKPWICLSMCKYLNSKFAWSRGRLKHCPEEVGHALCAAKNNFI